LGENEYEQRVRKVCGARKKLKEINSDLVETLESIVSPYTMGDPMKVLLWTNKSLRNIAKALNGKGFKITYVTVGYIRK